MGVWLPILINKTIKNRLRTYYFLFKNPPKTCFIRLSWPYYLLLHFICSALLVKQFNLLKWEQEFCWSCVKFKHQSSLLQGRTAITFDVKINYNNTVSTLKTQQVIMKVTMKVKILRKWQHPFLIKDFLQPLNLGY